MRTFFVAIAMLLFSSTAFAGAFDALTVKDMQQVDALALLLDTAKPFVPNTRVSRLVERMSMRDVTVLVSERTLDQGAFYIPGYIVIGAQFTGLPDSQLAFVIAHEYGHHMRAHWKTTLSRGLEAALADGKQLDSLLDIAPYLEAVKTRELSHSQELEADAMAVRLLRYFGLYDEQAVVDIVATFTLESDSHPSAVVRLANVLAQ